MAQERFDEILKSKMEGYQAQPPVDMFSRIESSLGKIEAPAESATAPRKVNLWSRPLVRYAAAAVAAAVVTTVAVTFNAPREELLTAQIETPATVQPVEIATPTAELAAATPQKASSESELPTIKRAPTNDATTATAKVTPTESIATEPATAIATDNVPTAEEQPKQAEPKSRKTKKSGYSEAELDAYWREVMAEDKKKAVDLSRLSTTLYAGNIGIGRGDMTLSNITPNGVSAGENTMSSVPQQGQFVSLPSAAPTAPTLKLQHRMPVTFGLTVAYSIGEQVAVESGLIYTNMFSSDKTEATSNYNNSQTLHYIGVPLAFTCRLFNLRNLGFYARVGGTVEKCVFAERRHYIDSVLDTTDKMTVDGLQFSVDASFGAQYPLWRGLSVYGEGGLSYYMPSVSQPESYRTANPLNAAIRIGFRYAFL